MPPRGQKWVYLSKVDFFATFSLMRKQMINRLGMADIRNTISSFSNGSISLEQASEALGIGKTRLYQLRSDFLAHRARGLSASWGPKSSGGNHKPSWPSDVQSFLKKALSCHYSYAFAASEVFRLFGLNLQRNQVRLWALDHGLILPPKKPSPPAHFRRWQRSYIGELWQLDATTERWFGPDCPPFTLLNMLDDCSRLQVSCNMYRFERISSYVHTFYNAFSQFGLPLQIYVDQASFFRSDSPDRLTHLASRLKFYDISFVLANSPEAKGKVERIHQVWQSRIPSFFRFHQLSPDSSLQDINQHLNVLRIHRNQHEIHREISMPPLQAWNLALHDHRSKLRPLPHDPWWEFVWADWDTATVGPRGKVRLANLDIPTQAPNGSRVWVCYHCDGSFSILANKPMSDKFPRILFSTKSP